MNINDSTMLPLSFKSQRKRPKKPFCLATSFHTDKKKLERFLENLSLFFRTAWLDWFTIIAVGTITAGVWVAPHTFTRLIPVTAPDGSIYWPTIAHPYVEPVFSPALAGALAAAIPIMAFAITQLWHQSFIDFASAVLGLSYSMVTGTCFQVILKKTIGGLRPHFLAVCMPVLPPTDGSNGSGYLNSFYTVEQLCTGDAKKIKNALESFPSGHATITSAGFGYLALYLFAHLRITTMRRRADYWRMLFVVAPLLFATYLTSTLVLGYHHHGHDVIFGALIGWLCAFFGYRIVFMAWFHAPWCTMPYLRLRDYERLLRNDMGEVCLLDLGEDGVRPKTPDARASN